MTYRWRSIIERVNPYHRCPDHKVVHYIGAVLPQSAAIIDTFTIADLRKEDVAKQFSTISTLYILPRDEHPVHSDMAEAFGIPAALVKPDTSVKWTETQHWHKKLYASAAMKEFMTDMALKPKFLEKYTLDPVAVAEAAEGLSDLERFGLKLARGGLADALMKATESDIASGRQLTEEEVANGNGSGCMPQ
ncbi:hypothetical protein K503DRAFT_801468 [Rhizopogon vinicolor AM-OR11-026]|uniref:Uncharacterized protein n=1 Tax=Rhizopogon vinicolor AM-OR11-026 TaxID=1314800 RepID=A0A1B7MWY8_9AGAM|nr:hypothetical protein K503DRAFT_801468 [Rhizopogon vinicolor AM-OR11-026]